MMKDLLKFALCLRPFHDDAARGGSDCVIIFNLLQGSAIDSKGGGEEESFVRIPS